ncbi:hypothetical protein AAW51_2165 [Caldimonas brevitalea]|uniref:PAAR domain-containing protein n=1 Tax=Caldimonas brevitalea TaxID=413882 RepID=A0A0G3BNC9_9BURK|nr:hypothetical protein AAW51_2165 [Caldimonas brevitalea]
MGRPLIVLGDKTSHGGVVIGASDSTDTHGKRIARVGDKVTCPKKGHGRVTTIATGDPTFIIDGAPAARHGDLCACGAQLLAAQYVTDVREGDAVGLGGAAQAEELANLAPQSTPDAPEPHMVRFQAIDDATGEALAKCPYIITRADGTEHGGLTDSEGYTAPLQADEAETVAVHFMFKSELQTIEREDLA